MRIPPKVKAWLVDVGERVGASATEAVVAAVAAGALAKGVNATTAHVLLIAGLTAGAATLKGILAAAVKGSVSPASLAPAQQPGQAEQDAPPAALPTRRTNRRTAHAQRQQNRRSEVAYNTPHDRLALLPPPSGRKGGALPSPVDERDYKAALPTTIPARVDNGAGLTFGMLLNDRIRDCYPAALLHALQVLSGGTFTPTDADVLHVYEQVTGYDPTRTKPDGSNPTDRGTAGRELFAWAKAHGLITRYAAVPVDRHSIRAAIASPHKAVLCEWALPVGAEREGAVWTMPRSGRAAGSWGYHATVQVGYTPTRNSDVTWGQEGTVTPAFEDAYLTAAWVIEVPAVIPPIG